MVDEFNRIVGDTLATEGAVHLPGVGSLVAVRRAAERISSRRLRRSCNAVMLTERVCGRSVADIVAEACGTDAGGGMEIYERWLSKVSAEGVVAIDGVGHIERGEFFVDEAFDKVLNPNGHDLVELVKYRRSNPLKWWLTAAAVLAAVVCTFCFTGLCDRCSGITASVALLFAPKDRPSATDNPADGVALSEMAGNDTAADLAQMPSENLAGPAAESTEKAVQEDEPATEIAAAGERNQTQSQQAVQKQPEAEQPARQPETEQPRMQPQAAPSQGVGRMTSGWSYVVCGVFSTPENAMRAVAEARARGVEGCSAFEFGQRYMVALYSSADAAECSAYMRSAKDFEDLWVYTAR